MVWENLPGTLRRSIGSNSTRARKFPFYIGGSPGGIAMLLVVTRRLIFKKLNMRRFDKEDTFPSSIGRLMIMKRRSYSTSLIFLLPRLFVEIMMNTFVSGQPSQKPGESRSFCVSIGR